jgi:hypothetical protein
MKGHLRPGDRVVCVANEQGYPKLGASGGVVDVESTAAAAGSFNHSVRVDLDEPSNDRTWTPESWWTWTLAGVPASAVQLIPGLGDGEGGGR